MTGTATTRRKRHALEALASLVQAILAPADEKVVRLKTG